jgi:hypothetical protein
MPIQKDFKRLVRTRMRKTGESYTAARTQLLKKKTVPPPAADTSLAGMSDAAVRKATGKTWTQWVRVLDAIDAAKLPHREIAKHLREQHAVPDWWTQTVTVGYERIRGLRDVGQRRGGKYEGSKSRTFPVPVSKLYGAFANARVRARWLPGVPLEVRTATKDKSMRITWDDKTSVHLCFTAKGDKKSQVAVQHVGLPAKADIARVKALWTERLDALANLLA